MELDLAPKDETTATTSYPHSNHTWVFFTHDLVNLVDIHKYRA
ncbi:hypothetical protein W04_1959 [Pseudoalteromonas sp. SW0106-04]|nr:hypothetical protein W04_1959 [Pseudoalteromonas sp. SW0106-04]